MTKRFVLAGATLALAAGLLAGCAAPPVEPPHVGMAPALAQYLDSSPEGLNLGFVARDGEALIQWERIPSWQTAEWLELVFTQGNRTVTQVLPPDATAAHIAGIVPGVGGTWSIVDSFGTPFNSGRFSPLALEH